GCFDRRIIQPPSQERAHEKAGSLIIGLSPTGTCSVAAILRPGSATASPSLRGARLLRSQGRRPIDGALRQLREPLSSIPLWLASRHRQRRLPGRESFAV